MNFFSRRGAAGSSGTQGPQVHPIGPNRLSWRFDRSVPADLRQNWRKNGYVVMPGLFSAPQIKAYVDTVQALRATLDDGKDEYGYGDRIGQLHQKAPELLELPSNPRILSFLAWALGDDPLLMGSLNFARGTTQDVHIDAIFFWPEPSYSMAGVWVALEDVHVDSGPLFYVGGSHKWPFFRSEDLVRTRPELARLREAARTNPDMPAAEKAAIMKQLGDCWTEEFKQLEAERQVPHVPLALKAGDVVVWHSLLAHGGSPRNNPALSRTSAVFHYFGSTAKLFTYDQFMLYDAADLPNQVPQSPERASYGALKYMRFPYFVTYPRKDEQVVHPL